MSSSSTFQLPNDADGYWTTMADKQPEAYEEKLDIGVLLQAMSRCESFYHQSDKIEFYGLVAEEYGTILPDFDDVSLGAIEKHEKQLRSVALQMTTNPEAIDNALQPHLDQIMSFYRSIDVVSAGEVTAESTEAQDEDPVTAPEEHSEGSRSAQSSHDDTGTHTDADVDTSSPDRRDESGDSSNDTSHALESNMIVSASAASLQQSADAHSSNTSQLTVRSESLDPRYAIDFISKLTKEREEAEQTLLAKEQQVAAETARLRERKQEYKQYKQVVKEHRQRDKERKRLRQLMEGPADNTSEDPSLQEARKALKKEQKRYQRLQNELSLRYKLLESENQRYEMKVEKEMADLRREYSESFLFPDIALP